VNLSDQHTPLSPDVAADDGGNFVIAWTLSKHNGDDDVLARRYDDAGAPIGAEFRVNTYTTNDQRDPAVATTPDGGFVVVWSSDEQDGDGDGIFCQRYDSAGQPVGIEFQVNADTAWDQDSPDLAVDGDGSFLVVWRTSVPEVFGLGSDVHARRHDSAGTPVGAELQVNTYTTGDQDTPAVAAAGNGTFVVVWINGDEQDGDGTGVFGQRYDTSGSAVGSEFQVNTYTTSYQTQPAVAGDGAGGFVVVWSSASVASGQDGDGYGIFGQRFDSGGAPAGSEFQVNTYTTGRQAIADVAVGPTGSFVVTWEGEDLLDRGVFGQMFDSGGLPRFPEFQVNTYQTGSQQRASVAVAGDETFLVAWQDVEILARRYIPEGDQPILGRTLIIRNPRAGETPSVEEKHRSFVLRGVEKATDVAGLLGDPTSDGAVLRVVVGGASPSDETYTLDPSGWSGLRAGRGFIFRNTASAPQPAPVRTVVLKRTQAGTRPPRALVRVVLAGGSGTEDLNVIPPDPGTDGAISLRIGGATYCVRLGGSSGGEIKGTNDARKLRIVATAASPANESQPCFQASPSRAFLDLPGSLL
jgi:hypothetical protein